MARRPERLERLHRRACAAAPTYPEVGATLRGPLPPGYAYVRRRIRLGAGQECFERAGAAVLDWAAQRGSGFGVYPGIPAAPGETVLISVRWPGALRLPGLVIPCRVLWTVAEPGRIGFAYGTLPGHPECGEESFCVVRDDRDQVWFEVTAFSRPATWYTRLGHPVARLLQRRATEGYLRAVAAAVA